MEYSEIPIVTNSEQLDDLIFKDEYKGLANVLLNRENVDYLLSLNTSNRNIKTHSVVAYVNAFEKRGYESIGLMLVSDRGVLADGQHRLTALQRLFNKGCNIGAWQVFRFGFSESRTVDIDNGVSRTYKDALALAGVLKDSKYAAALRTYAMLTAPNYRVKFTAAELIDIYERDFKYVFDIGTFQTFPGSGGLQGEKGYRPAPWVITAFRICQKKFGTENMKTVYEQFYNGTNLKDPMVFFRNKLLTSRGKFRFGVRSDGKTIEMLGCLFNAVQKCLDGCSDVKVLRSTKLNFSINGIDF